MSLSIHDAERLKSAGFTEYEIFTFSEATTPDGKPQPPLNLDSPAWKATLKSRHDWVGDKIARGWSSEEIENVIMSYYKTGTKRSPWDFLRIEYRPPTRLDYREAVRKRAAARVEAVLGKY